MKILLILGLVLSPIALADIGDITTCVAEHPELGDVFVGQGVQRAPIAFPSKIVARAKARSACKEAAIEANVNERGCKISDCFTE